LANPHGNNGQASYTFDKVGNRVQRASTLPAIPATGLLNYDANDRTSTDPYDANGNLLNGGVGTNVYDFENRLVQAGGVKLVYDGDGNRVMPYRVINLPSLVAAAVASVSVRIGEIAQDIGRSVLQEALI